MVRTDALHFIAHRERENERAPKISVKPLMLEHMIKTHAPEQHQEP